MNYHILHNNYTLIQLLFLIYSNTNSSFTTITILLLIITITLLPYLNILIIYLQFPDLIRIL